MGVTQTHKQYNRMKPEWLKNIDFMKSEREVKDKGETYLPALAEQDEDEYTKYKNRSSVVMYAQRANRSMTGMIGRKEAQVLGIKEVEDLVGEVDAQQADLQSYISKVLTRFLTTGRGATLIDVPRAEENLTVAQADAMGIRARFSYYTELDIINWRKERINNVEVLTLVVLREEITEVDESDTFSSEVVYQYRVLKLVEGVYWQQLWDADENMKWETAPKKDGAFMTEIPIVFHGGVDVIEPPLNGATDLNLHHYQLTADEIWGLRMAALPTPYFFGEDPTDPKFPNYVGPGKVIGCEDVNAKAGFREFSGAGLGAVAAKLQNFADQIAAMTVQMATEQINKSATGSTIDYANSTSSLAGVANILSTEMTQALKILAEWEGKPADDIEVLLNTDFLPNGIDSASFAVLLDAYLKGTISYETYYNNLAKGEITDPHQDAAEEQRKIIESLPPGLTLPGNSDGLDDDEDEDDDNNDEGGEGGGGE